MRRLGWLLVGVLLLGVDNTTALADRGVEIGIADPGIDALFARWHKPGSSGCAVAIAVDGEMTYSRGYGFANLDHSVPITPQTLFDVASITKQFVAASLVTLELDGKLSFDDDVRLYLPELPVYDAPVTLQHMVYHTSGLRDYLNLFPLAGRDDFFPISQQHILDMMARQQALNFMPGERYEYSNTAYMLLALVVERVSGQRLGDYVQQRLFKPAGMSQSLMYDDAEEIIPGRAIGYGRDATGSLRQMHNFSFAVPGDGQMYATVNDLLRWDDYLHGANRPPFYDTLMLPGELSSGVRLSHAKGLYLDIYRGVRTIHHTGGSWGFRSVIKRFVEPNLSVAIACNDDAAQPRQLALQIADCLLADELAPPPAAIAPVEASDDPIVANSGRDFESQSLQAYTGEYFSSELDAIYRIIIQNEELMVRIEQEPATPLRALAQGDFEFLLQPRGWPNGHTVSVSFVRAASGAVTGLLVSLGAEREIPFNKVELAELGVTQ